jgi:tRNA (guanosine-2'-O-)-methyltransferase
MPWPWLNNKHKRSNFVTFSSAIVEVFVFCTPLNHHIMTPERRQRLSAILERRQGNLTVLMENVSDPHNISAVMRTCDAVGIQDVYILNTLIPTHKKWGKKSSSSASKWLTIHQFTDLDRCLKTIQNHYGAIYTTRLSGDAVSLYEMDLTQSMALVFGNEKDGVSAEISARADGNFIIPQMGMIRSLNISVACAVTLYEAFRQKSAAGHYATPSLSAEKKAQIAQKWGLQSENQQED